MIDFDTSLRPHFFPVPVAQWVRQVPTDTRQDNVSFKAVASQVDHAGSQVRTGAGSLTESGPSRLTQQNLRFTLLEALPPLRMLLIFDNLAGHKTATFVCWLMAHGIMPLYTPISGSWLNMAESIQRILVSRALAGQHPENPAQLIAWLEAVARGWNAHPTPFIWGGSRPLRRQQARERRYHLGGSGAVTHQPVPHQGTDLNGDQQSK